MPDAASAAERVGPPLDRFLQGFRGRTGAPPAAEEWPPPNTATLDDLFRVARESVAPLHEGWDSHVSDALRHASRLRARRGEVSGATELLEAIPVEVDHLRGCAEVATILATAGYADQAREIFSFTAADVEEVLDEYNVAFVASSVAGAYAALGETARADTWFDRARASIDPEANSGQNRLTVAWALVECGRVDDARALWQQANRIPSTSYSLPFLAYLARTGRDHLAREILTFRDPAAEQWRPKGWFDRWSAVEAAEVLASLGRSDLIRDWAQVYGERYPYEELLEKAEKNAQLGTSRRPTRADLDALAEAYATLQKTPRTQRDRPTGLLILQAAECGHLGAVLDLLRRLSADDFNGRASHAFRSLWILATGAGVEPW